jgi:Ni,Fe-hydrogenase III large subunit/Ni,Fe-hydrogenase III component G
MKELTALRTSLESTLREFNASSFTERNLRFEFQAPRERAAAAAAALMENFSLELSLILGNDRRADRGVFEIYYLFTHPGENWFAQMRIDVPPEDPRFPSLATTSYSASLYEREIHDLFGLVAEDHPDLRPMVRHGFWPDGYYPLRRDSEPPAQFSDDGNPFPFRQVEGEGVYEIPVGPVHAGVIEPGHFRFSVDGETIIDMKARLYFTHKGTEKLFEGRPAADGIELAERISGDTSIGHSLAYCQAVENLAGITIPARAAFARVILLEMERLYNHVADFGAIANDTGFAVAHAHAFRIRERLLRINKRITGHRLLRGMLRPGGMGKDLASVTSLPGELDDIRDDFDQVVDICWNNSMLRDRLRGTGRLTERTARDHSVLGYVARGSNIDRDARRDHPFAAYDRMRFKVPVFEGGDVEARTLVRIEEFRISIDLIRQAVAGMPSGAILCDPGSLPAWQSAWGIVEAWRGSVLHWLMTDGAGRVYRVKVKDPSFVNWRALTFALLKNIVPDFPLCNKSFNLSYSGNDL